MSRASLLAPVTAAAAAVPLGVAATGAPPADPPLGISGPPAGQVVSRLDPVTLAPLGASAALGEYHDTWSPSPDGTRLAFGLSAEGHGNGRTAVRVIDRRSLAVVAELEAGAAARAVGWVGRQRIAALTIPHEVHFGAPGSPTRIRRYPGELILGDAAGGPPLARRPAAFPEGCAPASATTPAGFAVLVSGRAAGSARLALVDATGRIRSVALPGIPGRVRDGACGGLAVDPSGRSAYVVAAGAPMVAVDLASLTARVEPATVRGAARACGSGAGGCIPRRSAVPAGPGRLAVFGTDGAGRAGRANAGARLVDVASGRSRTLDARAGTVVAAGGMLLSFGGPDGLRAFGLDGRPRYHRLAGRRVQDVQIAGTTAYARAGSALEVLEVATGRTLSTARAPGGTVQLLGDRP